MNTALVYFQVTEWKQLVLKYTSTILVKVIQAILDISLAVFEYFIYKTVFFLWLRQAKFQYFVSFKVFWVLVKYIIHLDLKFRKIQNRCKIIVLDLKYVFVTSI